MSAAKAGKSDCRATLAELTDALSKAEKEGHMTESPRICAPVSPLIVCGTGCLPVTGGGNTFFQPVSARYVKGAVILTLNR